MHRAVLTPKRLISNLFAIRPYIVKVIPLAGIAAGSLLPVDFGHGQFTRLDRDFILQKTILSRQLWKQTARRQFRPPPRAHPRALAELRRWEQGSPRPVPLLPLRCRAQVTPRGLDGEALRRGIVPLSGDPHPTVGAPRARPAGVAFGDSVSCPPHGPRLSACTGSAAGRMVALNGGLPALAILASPSPAPVNSSGKGGCQHSGIFPDILQGGLDVHPLITIPLLLSLLALSPQRFE